MDNHYLFKTFVIFIISYIYIYYYWNKREGWGSVGSGLSKFGKDSKKGLDKFGKDSKKGLDKFGKDAKKGLDKTAKDVEKAAKDAAEAAKKAAEEAAKAALDALNALEKIWNDLVNATSKIGPEFNKITSGIRNFGKEVANVGNDINNGLKEVEKLKKLPDQIGDTITNEFNKITEQIEGNINKSVDEINNFSKSTFKAIKNESSKTFKKTTNKLEKEFNNTTKEMTKVSRDLADTISNFAIWITNELAKVFEGVLKTIQNFFENSFLKALLSVFDMIGDTFHVILKIIYTLIEFIINIPYCIPVWLLTVLDDVFKTYIPKWFRTLVYDIIVPVIGFFMHILKTILIFFGFNFNFNFNTKKCYPKFGGILEDFFNILKELMTGWIY